MIKKQRQNTGHNAVVSGVFFPAAALPAKKKNPVFSLYGGRVPLHTPLFTPCPGGRNRFAPQPLPLHFSAFFPYRKEKMHVPALLSEATCRAPMPFRTGRKKSRLPRNGIPLAAQTAQNAPENLSAHEKPGDRGAFLPRKEAIWRRPPPMPHAGRCESAPILPTESPVKAAA